MHEGEAMRRTGAGISTLVAILVIAIAAGCGSENSGTSNGAASTSSSGPKKATNGDDAKDLHNRAQQAVNQAESCLAAVYIASQEKSGIGAMASDLQQARGMCNEARRYLATNNSHGFSDQNL
jgi:hypothetical protein